MNCRLPAAEDGAAGACGASAYDSATGAEAGAGAATAAGRGAATVPASEAGIETFIRVSMRSMRCSRAASVSLADGSSSRAHTTSSSSRGAVAPRISPSPACMTSA
ncbi:Uncharacterised protein [Mycobacteroides abscessus subsp. abscessus]|nr:Uncharacterised protein [Mycobacteroides abscessus subsp. abscessus]